MKYRNLNKIVSGWCRVHTEGVVDIVLVEVSAHSSYSAEFIEVKNDAGSRLAEAGYNPVFMEICTVLNALQ